MLRFAPQLLLISAVCLLGVASCPSMQSTSPTSANKPAMKLPESTDEARAAILAKIPIGTPAAAARAKLTELGFQVSVGNDEAGSAEFFARLDQPTDSIFVSQNFMVFVRLNERAQVADVEVKTGFTGL